MGVYIKGMEMPKSCIKCKEYQPYREYCKLLKRYLIGMLWKDERHEDCPLVEVPEPHGRLVDYETIDVDYWEDADGYHISIEAETVIEAEGE